MKKISTIIACLLLHTALPAQDTMQVVTRQCSAIRELVYAGTHEQFELIRVDETRTSSGYTKSGNWEFSTTRYQTKLPWADATTSYIEHSEEKMDSMLTHNWQYIAEYSNVPNLVEAEKLYRYLNGQISGCRYPISDTAEINFRPLPAEKLPKERPAALETASLYDLPFNSLDPTRLPPPISVMVGMEKRKNSYRISLIVENQLVEKMGSSK
ncbi:MAG: hypothetical protein ABIX01_20040 [Chitinophagaceae bacterium]